mmetsp:Transcript_28050/g.41299  ORF Transcript_28050/g.41299 Transcript_28050/m.41299 type:complete len:424 (-) Transcript_28050:136-1407(-)|eukprot:CAMPEP_0194049390 /NCGR_PEP_ID=MMETSP0009_2-20130614/30583_1 /TAXON_ID=210454 /ORGANISM="Grammatophora oceanica, Strain CCMP 410" /LENGTH=423 /DNA_ID=CAMNT_0038695537 /DNA_START=248 /DNA_END=1522 /DNA_ORIENTATION=+
MSQEVPTATNESEEEQSVLTQVLRALEQVQTVQHISMKDILSAADLLSGATPGGLDERKKAAANNVELEGADDPVHQYLWNLVMKIREGPEHVEELIEVEVFDRITSIMLKTNADKKYENLPPLEGVLDATAKDWKLARPLRRDSIDLVFCIAVIHELCRYRSGCVALAKYTSIHEDSGRSLWLNYVFMIATENIHLIAMYLGTKSWVYHDGFKGINWGDPMAYELGMIEQGAIDTIGRLLNGLDQNPKLRLKIAHQVGTQLRKVEKKTRGISCYMVQSEIPKLNHCIDLEGSLDRVLLMIQDVVEGDSKPKAWKSTFLVERHHIDDPSKVFGAEEQQQERMCHACSKEGKHKVCARCKTACYCSRECQVKAWKTHKKNCVKHKGIVPTEDSWHEGHSKNILRTLKRFEDKTKTAMTGQGAKK